jgi:hypothetical protein
MPKAQSIWQDLVALARKQEIFFRNPSLVMRGEGQRPFVKANVDIQMVIAFLSFSRDPVDKADAF